jgi:hypothetical protein
MAAAAPKPRKGMPSPRLDEPTFKSRFRSAFVDPAFDALSPELDKIAAAAWDAYDNHRKSPRTEKAGPGYADPDYDLATDWMTGSPPRRRSTLPRLGSTTPRVPAEYC